MNNEFNDFKSGDRVQILSKVSYSGRSESGIMLNRIGTVLRKKTTTSYYVRIDDREYSFSYNYLKLLYCGRVIKIV